MEHFAPYYMRIIIFIFSVMLQSLGVCAWSTKLLPAGRLTSFSLKNSFRGFGNKYGKSNNSSILSPNELAEKMNLKPFARMPSRVWSFAWRTHGRLLPFLHWWDKAKPRDADQSLKVVWNKAIASLDKRSPAFDYGWTYGLLPGHSRWLLKVIPTVFFPRMHHANIEIRTAYLNNAIQQEIDDARKNDVESGRRTKIRLFALGSGYDSRYARMLTTGLVDEAWELDIKSVVESKRMMLNRIKRRRGEEVLLPHFRSVDLNDVASFQNVLRRINKMDEDPSTAWHTIFVSEGVFIYLKDGIPLKILKTCKEEIPLSSFCFADLLREVEKGSQKQANDALSGIGWTLEDWLPKPGLARHMGVCR